MYKRWMTFFLILIFTPIHLSIADKVMRTNSLALSIIFTLVELAIFFYVGRKYDLFHIRKISLKDMLKWLLSYALLVLFYMLVNFLGPTQSDTTQSIQSLSLSLPELFLDLCILYWTKIKKHLIIVVMKLTNEETQKIEQLLKDSSYAKYHKRLQIIYFRSKGKSYKEIMDLLDCNKTTVWRNLKKYKEFGLEALLQETRGGRHREYMTYEEEQAFLKRHIEAAQAGEFVTVNQLFEAYQKEIGRTSTRDGFYYLLKRHGWRTVTPRPEHPKKADAQTIETSKNKIYIRDLK